MAVPSLGFVESGAQRPLDQAPQVARAAQAEPPQRPSVRPPVATVGSRSPFKQEADLHAKPEKAGP